MGRATRDARDIILVAGNVQRSWVDAIIYSIPCYTHRNCVPILDTRYSCCESSLYKLKLLIISEKTIEVAE